MNYSDILIDIFNESDVISGDKLSQLLINKIPRSLYENIKVGWTHGAADYYTIHQTHNGLNGPIPIDDNVQKVLSLIYEDNKLIVPNPGYEIMSSVYIQNDWGPSKKLMRSIKINRLLNEYEYEG